MKRLFAVLTTCAATVAGGIALQAPSAADDATARTSNYRGDAAQLDPSTPGHTIRASQLTGMNIENNERKSVGEINDLVIDFNTGKVRYAAVTYGGFLGIGDKLFAVPFEAFQTRANPDDPDEQILVLNVTQKTLEGAQGFDQENWPDFADQNFTRQLDKRYGVQRNRANQGVGVNVDRNGVRVNVNPNRN